jgi:hypothetical protein
MREGNVKVTSRELPPNTFWSTVGLPVTLSKPFDALLEHGKEGENKKKTLRIE